ncbi:MAG TPA: cytochrome c [Phototrophicaceae bacterium]|nr:cytochrome c [Phototrophicaceae bacterium]
MDGKWRLSCCVLPLFFMMCVCSTVILIGAGVPVVGRQAIQVTGEYANETLTRQNPPSPLESQIQIPNKPFTDTQLAEGQAIYLQQCAACHGVEGQGQFPEAPLVPDSTGRIGAPPHNETGHSWHHSDTVLIRYIIEGGFSDPTRFYTMPPFGTILTEEQVLLVIAYIKTLWTDEQRGMQRQLTEEEQELFSN